MNKKRKIKGIVNWMIPKNSDEGMFYAHTLAIADGEWHRQAKVINVDDIAIPPKIIEDKEIKVSQAKIFKDHEQFINSHLNGAKPDAR